MTALACVICAISFWMLAPSLAIVSCLLGWTMLAIAAVDARHYIIPDALSLPAIPAGLMASGTFIDAAGGGLVNVDNVIGAIAGGASLYVLRAVYFYLRRREGLGFGDVKLGAAAGAWTGWQNLSVVFLLASTLALSFIVAQTILRRAPLSNTAKVPFGAFLAAAIWLIWLLDAYGRGS
jgi:leader peptidase (prepilin peptidase) / N-methyltransferase